MQATVTIAGTETQVIEWSVTRELANYKSAATLEYRAIAASPGSFGDAYDEVLIERSDNLLAKTEPELGDYATVSAGIEAAAFGGAYGLDNGLSFPGAAQEDYAYNTSYGSVVDGETYTFSVYVSMIPAAVPVPDVAPAGDFQMVIGGNVVPASQITVENVSGDIYRVSATETKNPWSFAQNTCGVHRDASQSGNAFIVTGFQLVTGSTIPDYVRVGDSRKVFAGYITAIDVDPDAEQIGYVRVRATCADYRFILDSIAVFDASDSNYAKVFTSQNDRAIVQGLTQFYATGFSAPDATVENTASISRAPFKSSFSDALTKLCSYTGLSWYVDQEKVIHYFTPSNDPAIFSLADGEFVVNSYSLEFFSPANQVIVLGGRARSGDPNITPGYEIIRTRNNTTSQTLYGQTFSRFHIDRDIETSTQADSIGDEILARAAYPNERLSITIYSGEHADQDLLQPGQLLTITHTDLGLTSSPVKNYVVQRITTRQFEGAPLEYHTEHKVELGDYLPDLAALFRKLERNGQSSYAPVTGVRDGIILKDDLAFDPMPPYTPIDVTRYTTLLTASSYTNGTGTVSITGSSMTGTGGTTFLTDFVVGTLVDAGTTTIARVDSITSDTVASVTKVIGTDVAGVAYAFANPSFTDIVNVSGTEGRILTAGITISAVDTYGAGLSFIDAYLTLQIDGQTEVKWFILKNWSQGVNGFDRSDFSELPQDHDGDGTNAGDWMSIAFGHEHLNALRVRFGYVTARNPSTNTVQLNGDGEVRLSVNRMERIG